MSWTYNRCLISRCLGLFILAAILIGCNKPNNHPANVLRESRERGVEKSFDERFDDALVRTNQIVGEKEAQKIRGYLSRRNWNMRLLPNGIYYEELRKGDGIGFVQDQTIVLEYRIELLDGSLVYDSKEEASPMRIKLGSEDDIIIGLLYILEKMSLGAKARAIIPPNHAYGLRGDGNKIPPGASLVYFVEVKSY